jgi:mRNA interferase HigB
MRGLASVGERVLLLSSIVLSLPYRHASILASNRVVFNIAGNKYRLVVKVNYSFDIAYVRFIGTHRQYDTIDAAAV